MAIITPLNGALTAGMASQSGDTINPSAALLVTGDNPGFMSETLGLDADVVLPAMTVVALDGSGNVVVAEDGTPAIGFAMYAADSTGEAAGAVKVEVVRMGCYNPDALAWDDSYTTAAKKEAAFRGAPTPTAIFIRKPQAMTV